jgi:hypothetical protein
VARSDVDDKKCENEFNDITGVLKGAFFRGVFAGRFFGAFLPGVFAGRYCGAMKKSIGTIHECVDGMSF